MIELRIKNLQLICEPAVERSMLAVNKTDYIFYTTLRSKTGIAGVEKATAMLKWDRTEHGLPGALRVTGTNNKADRGGDGAERVAKYRQISKPEREGLCPRVRHICRSNIVIIRICKRMVLILTRLIYVFSR